MVAAAMGNPRGRLAVLALSVAALAVAGCGGERQDADAPTGSFDVEVTGATFPERQRVAEPTTLRLEVANRGDRAVPNLAVTVETEPQRSTDAPVAFAQAADEPALADSARPVWVLDAGPSGGDTAYVNTWAVGPLAKGQTRTIEWKLTAVEAGRYRVAWRLSPALVGDAELRGTRTSGRFDVTVADAPVPATVDSDGEVVRGD